jgi:hypothetical protein
MEDLSKLENSNNIIIIDNKLNSVIRSYKQDDNIIYSYGINNIIVGLIKISSISSENENKENEEFDYESFKNLIPIGMYINGVIAIYNENTYEDFESVLEEQIEKIQLLQNNKKINYIRLALKEMLYLDDNEDLSFEFKKFGEIIDDLEIIFIENPIEKSSNYFYFVNRINIYFNDDKKEDRLDIEINEDISKKIETNKDLICNISDKENNQEFMIDNINSLTKENSEHITKLFEKLNIITQSNDINLKSIFIQIGTKDLFFSNINIKNISLKLEENESCDLYLETVGLLSKKENNYNPIIIEIYNKTLQNIQNFLKSIESNELTQNLLLYNKLYSSLPLQITQKTEIKREENEIKIFKKSKIENENFLKNLHIKALITYNLNPIREIIPLEKNNNSIHIKSPHLKINKEISSSHIIRALIKGDYLYYHYNQDNINDAGWGCAYRSLQTLFSWFTLNTSLGKGKKIPSISEIQMTLVKLGDKDKSLIGSSGWIGAVEVNLVLNELLGIESQIIFVPSGKDISSKGRDLLFHFQNQGTPIMIGGGVFAYTILGIDYDVVKGDCMLLILDPHYSGEDDVKHIISKGWCDWKSLDLFKKDSFYNMCLPLVN